MENIIEKEKMLNVLNMKLMANYKRYIKNS